MVNNRLPKPASEDFMKIEQYTCDSCGVVKGETNHWWRIFTHSGGFFSIYPWATDVAPANGESEIHLCGEQCVTLQAGAFMEGCKKQARSELG